MRFKYSVMLIVLSLSHFSLFGDSEKSQLQHVFHKMGKVTTSCECLLWRERDIDDISLRITVYHEGGFERIIWMTLNKDSTFEEGWHQFILDRYNKASMCKKGERAIAISEIRQVPKIPVSVYKFCWSKVRRNLPKLISQMKPPIQKTFVCNSQTAYESAIACAKANEGKKWNDRF